MKRPRIEELEKDHTPKHAYNSMVVCPHEWKKLLAYIHYLERELEEAKAFGKRADKAYQDAKDTIQGLRLQIDSLEDRQTNNRLY